MRLGSATPNSRGVAVLRDGRRGGPPARRQGGLVPMPFARTSTRARACPGLPGALGLAAVWLLCGPAPVAGAGDDPPAVLRDGFESPRTVWGREQTDATINLLAHD